MPTSRRDSPWPAQGTGTGSCATPLPLRYTHVPELCVAKRAAHTPTALTGPGPWATPALLNACQSTSGACWGRVCTHRPGGFPPRRCKFGRTGVKHTASIAFCGHTCEHPLHRTHPHPSVCCVWPAEAARRVFPVCSTEQPQLHHSRQGLQARPQSSAHSGPPPVRRRVTECLLRRTRYRSESGRGWGGQLGDGNHRRRHRLLQLAGQLAGGEQSPAWPRCRSLGR